MSTSDVRLARLLLSGFVEQGSDGRLRSKYLQARTREELDARRAIARLLRGNGPLDRQLRDRLADLFDPSSAAGEPRKIELVNRARGRTNDPIANTQIAEAVWNTVVAGQTITKAIDAAVGQFSVSEDLVKKIWGRYRPVLARVYGPLPRKRGKHSSSV
jgi:hypothetical protein